MASTEATCQPKHSVSHVHRTPILDSLAADAIICPTAQPQPRRTTLPTTEAAAHTQLFSCSVAVSGPVPRIRQESAKVSATHFAQDRGNRHAN
jgi:hypothetical protein